MNLRLMAGLILIGGSFMLGAAARLPLSITIISPSKSFPVGSLVRLEIVAKNISSDPIHWAEVVAENRAELDFEVIVQKRNGGEASETTWGRRVHWKYGEDPRSGLSIVTGKLSAGAIAREVSFLDKIYDLTPGQYTVQVERHGPGLSRPLLGISKRLKITIESQ